MTNNPYAKSAMVYAALETITPPLICDTLLQDLRFRHEHGLTVEHLLSFGDNEVTVLRAEFLSVVRALLSGASATKVNTLDGQEWSLEDASDEGEPATFALSRAQHRILLPDFAALSEDSSTRLRSLDNAAEHANLPDHARDAWRELLEERPLDDDEIVDLHSDLRDTPASVARSIKAQSLGGCSASRLLSLDREGILRDSSDGTMVARPSLATLQAGSAPLLRNTATGKHIKASS